MYSRHDTLNMLSFTSQNVLHVFTVLETDSKHFLNKRPMGQIAHLNKSCNILFCSICHFHFKL